jgi:hypothetical protein
MASAGLVTLKSFSYIARASAFFPSRSRSLASIVHAQQKSPGVAFVATRTANASSRATASCFFRKASSASLRIWPIVFGVGAAGTAPGPPVAAAPGGPPAVAAVAIEMAASSERRSGLAFMVFLSRKCS